jgi:hypothetical protein
VSQSYTSLKKSRSADSLHNKRAGGYSAHKSFCTGFEISQFKSCSDPAERKMANNEESTKWPNFEAGETFTASATAKPTSVGAASKQQKTICSRNKAHSASSRWDRGSGSCTEIGPFILYGIVLMKISVVNGVEVRRTGNRAQTCTSHGEGAQSLRNGATQYRCDWPTNRKSHTVLQRNGG